MNLNDLNFKRFKVDLQMNNFKAIKENFVKNISKVKVIKVEIL